MPVTGTSVSNKEWGCQHVAMARLGTRGGVTVFYLWSSHREKVYIYEKARDSQRRYEGINHIYCEERTGLSLFNKARDVGR